MTKRQRVLLASTNPAKQERLAWLLGGLGLDMLRPDDLGLHVSVPEEGASHRDDAELKARAWSRAADGLAIASDGGVLIPAMGNAWDSLQTHRFAGDDASEAQRAQRLLELMRRHTGAARRISWVEAVAVAERGALLRWWEEEGAEGVLAEEVFTGKNIPGFWVASLWHFPALGKRYAELTQAELDAVGDHWSRLRPQVRAFFHV